MSADLHVEHIIPLEFKKFKELSHIGDSDFEVFVNSIGNLTLLSGAKNIEASNNPFHVKLDVYKGLGKHKTKKSGVTSFEISKLIVEKHSAVEGVPNWLLSDTKNRWNWFCDEFSRIFEFDLKSLKHEI